MPSFTTMFSTQIETKNFFNEIEYDKLYPSGSAPARIYGTSKMHKFPSSDSFPKLYFLNYFSYKDPIPNDLKSFLVYTFTYASCSSSYIDKTCRHFKTRIEEHIKKDKKFHIFYF